jgi:hypothetical protein
MGSIFFSIMGYQLAFFAFAILLIFAGILSFFVLPNNLNAKLDTMSDLERAQSEKIANTVPYSWFFRNRRSIFGLATCTYVCVIFSFSGPFFTPALKEEKGIPEFYHGFIIGI